MTTNDKHLLIYCDGGSRGNPGPAASAFVVLDSSGHQFFQQGFFLGETTNNQAEYQAVIEALKWLTSQVTNNQLTINFYLDSELVVRQLTGVYKIKDENLKTKHTEIKKLIANCQLLIANFAHVPREQNKPADLLVNQTLDQYNKILSLTHFHIFNVTT